MINYSIYERATGRILRTGQSQATTLEFQATSDSEALVPGVFSGDENYIHQGRAMVRPSLPEVTQYGRGWAFTAPVPDGTIAEVNSRFFAGQVPVTGQAFALAVRDPEATIKIVPPFPYREIELNLSGEDETAPENAAVIAADLELMRSYFKQATYDRSMQMAQTMLGDPDDATQKRWLLKRAIYDKRIAGNLTAADTDALEQEVLYSGSTVDDLLTAIGQKVDFENWVTLRADGLRNETQKRLDEAVDAIEILAVIAWAEAESMAAVAEAQGLQS